MGAEQSRFYADKQRPVRKRLSLPLQLLTASQCSAATLAGRSESKPSGCVANQTTPSSSSIDQHEKPIGVDQNQPGNVLSYPIVEDVFSEFEQDVLLSTWPLISGDLLKNGWLVFQNAFNIYPDLSKFFNFDQLQPECEAQIERANRHIQAFMTVLADAIDSLDTDDREPFYERMMLLGAKHAAIPGMKTEYFKIFKQAILMTWEGLMYEEFTDDVRRAWAHLIDYIIGMLNEGCLVFEEEEEKILLETQTSHRASDGQLLHYGTNSRRRSGQPSVVSMTSDELAHFYSLCK